MSNDKNHRWDFWVFEYDPTNPFYREGWDACKSVQGDVTKASNPHEPETEPWARWNAGWNDRQLLFLREEKEGRK